MKIENNYNKKYKSNKSMVFSCQYHIIWSTKYRRKILNDNIQNRIKEIILNKQKDWLYEVIEMELMEDHIHLLIDVDPNLGINKIIGRIKGITSNLIRKEFPEINSKVPTLWTRSKFISTVGAVTLDVVKKYIEDQKNV